MGFDMMSYLRNAWSWFGGADTKGGTHVDGGVSVGAGAGGASIAKGSSIAGDVLGGAVGGFDQPLNWKGAGFGGVVSGGVTDKDGSFIKGYGGGGLGGGYATIDGVDSKGYKMNGGAIAAGGVAPIGGSIGGGGGELYAGTNVYKGAGASAYSYDNGKGDSGVGAKGSYTPLGLMDTNYGFKSDIVNYGVHADNAYLQKAYGDAKFGQDGSKYYGDVSGGLQSGVEGVKTDISTQYGKAGMHADSVKYGVTASGGGYYDSKTGAWGGNASYSDGISAKNVGGSLDVGAYHQSIAGDVAYGNAGKLSGGYDPTTGTFRADLKDGHTGGVRVNNAKAHYGLDGVGTVDAKLGEFSNDIQFSGYTEVDKNHAKIAGSGDFGGIRINDAQVDAQFGKDKWYQTDAQAKIGSLGSTNSFKNGYLEADWKNGALNAGFEQVAVGGWAASNLEAGFKGPGGINANAKLGNFNQGLTLDGGKVSVTKDGYAATLDAANYADVSIKDASYDVNLGKYYHADAKLGEFGTNHTVVNGAEAGFSIEKQGYYAGAKDARYDSVYLKGVEANQGVNVGGMDLYKSHLGLGEGYYNSFQGKNIKMGADLKNGLTASLEDGKYRYLGGSDIKADINAFDGNLGVGLGAKEASALGVDIGKLDYKSTLLNTDLSVQNLGAHGFKSKDIEAHANIGKVGAGVGAKELNLLDLNIGQAEAHTKMFGLQGNASLKDATLDAINVKGGHAGLSWDGKEFAGATGDYRAGAGVGSAEGNWDITKGTANGKFKDANIAQQLSNAKLNLFGNEIAVPDMGYKLNASGGGNVDLTRGAAQGNVSLGGSSVNFGGRSVTVPDWVQASGGVDLSRGAVNANLGGNNGVGVNASIAEGNLDVNLFGHTVDVDGGIRSAGNAVANTARAGANAVAGAGRWVADRLPSLPSLW